MIKKEEDEDEDEDINDLIVEDLILSDEEKNE